MSRLSSGARRDEAMGNCRGDPLMMSMVKAGNLRSGSRALGKLAAKKEAMIRGCWCCHTPLASQQLVHELAIIQVQQLLE